MSMKKAKAAGRRIAAAAAAAGSALMVGAHTAYARGSGVSISPNSTGLPGISQGEKLVGALITVGVVAAVAGFGMSAIVWAVGNHSANPQVAGRGKTGVVVSAACAIVCGAAMALVNFFFNVGSTI